MKKNSKKKLWIYDGKWLKFGSITGVKCKYCHINLFYFYKYDAVCCPRCNIWTETKCNDPNCEFCKNRPESPEIGIYDEINSNINQNVNLKYYYTEKYAHKFKRQNHRNKV